MKSTTSKVRVCNRCGNKAVKEKNVFLRLEYPFYCENCDENMYTFETTKITVKSTSMNKHNS